MSFIKVSNKRSGILNQELTNAEWEGVKAHGLEDILHGSPDLGSTVIIFSGNALIISPGQLPHLNIDRPKLSFREVEVLQYLVNGNSIEQTALKMEIKPRTVRKFLDNLRIKFNADSRDQLMARAG